MLTTALEIACAVLVATYAFCGLLAASSRGWISHRVRIAAPVDAVWEYGSDSGRASEWSVYFDHITPVEGDGRPADGTVGALRICYRNADDSGPRWSETTEAAEPLRHREIRTFDLRGFQFGPIVRFTVYEVHQDYDAVGAHATDLTFRCRVVPPRGLLGHIAYPVLKATYLVVGREAAQQVFEWNLENIRAAVEARHDGRPYERPHPWAESLAWETTPLRWWLRYVGGPLVGRRPEPPRVAGGATRAMRTA